MSAASWYDEAMCRGKTHLMYPANPLGGDPGQYAQARKAALKLCSECPVKGPCSKAAQKERFGIWAGTSRDSRNRGNRSGV